MVSNTLVIHSQNGDCLYRGLVPNATTTMTTLSIGTFSALLLPLTLCLSSSVLLPTEGSCSYTSPGPLGPEPRSQIYKAIF